MRVRHLFVTSASLLAVCVVRFGLVLFYSAPARAELPIVPLNALLQACLRRSPICLQLT